MAGFGIGFGALTASRQYAALSRNVPVSALRPSAAWNGAAGSGFAGGPPSDPARQTAKPVCRLLTPPNQYFVDELVIGVRAGANHFGSLLDDFGIEKVVVHCEGEVHEIAAPSFYLHEDANGQLRRYLGWWVILQHPGLDGHAHVYFEAVPKDASMQNRVIGPYQFSPQSQLHDVEIEVAPSAPELAGERYQSIVSALDHLTSVAAQNPLITISESLEGDFSLADPYAGGEGYCTIAATQPVTLKKPGPALVSDSAFRPRVDGLWFRGENITIDFNYARELYHEDPAGGRQHVFEGVRLLDSGGRYYTHQQGPKPTFWIARGNPYFLECEISDIPDPCMGASLVRGSVIRDGCRDVASAARCVVGNRITGWSSHEYREEIDALTVSYGGAANTATLELAGGNESDGRTFTAREDGAVVATFTVYRNEAAYLADTNYTVENVAAWLNALPGWSASVLDSTRRATALSIPGIYGAGFAATDVRTGPLTLVTMFDQHSDIWALNPGAEENLIFSDNLCFGNLLQSMFIQPQNGLQDCLIANNCFDLDESLPDASIVFSQLQGACSHLVVVHNSWSNQSLSLRPDKGFDPDASCLFANNVLPSLFWTGAADAELVLANNHLFDGAVVPGGAVATVVGGSKATLFVAPSLGDFTPTGSLLFNQKAPIVRFDRAGNARGIPAAVGASAGGAELAPAIISANPSGTYPKGVAIGGKLAANKPVTWSAVGPDAAIVQLDPATGDWQLPPTDFETKASYSFTFIATDASGDNAEQVIAIQISDLDEIAPQLATASAQSQGSNSASLTVVTDEANGTLFWLVSEVPTAPLAAALINGTGGVASGSQAVASAGEQAVSLSGLLAGTTYFAHFLHRDGAGNVSAVATSAGFATAPPASGSIVVEEHGTILNTTDSEFDYFSGPFAHSGAAGNTLIVVVAIAQGWNQVVDDLVAQVNGEPMALVAGGTHSLGASRPIIAVYAATGLAAGAKTISLSMSNKARSCTILAMEVSGLDTQNLLANMAVIEGEGSSYSHSYTPNAADNLLLSVVATRKGDMGPMVPDPAITPLQDESTGDTAANDHTVFSGYRLAQGTAAVDIGATPTIDTEILFLAAELNAA